MESNDLSDKRPRDLSTKENVNKLNNLKQEKICSGRIHDKNSESNSTELFNKVTAEDLQKLCNQLSAFNLRIQNAREIIHLRYDLPNKLQERLEAEAAELECLHREMQDATNNLMIVRSQRAALGKEKLSMEEHIGRIKAELVNELEVIVSVYDSNMMQQWETVKNGKSIPATENFLHDVKGKLQAMKNLQVLGTQKLTDLRNEEEKKIGDNLKKEKKRKNREERAGRSRNRSTTNLSNVSQTTLPFLLDTDSEDMFEENTVHSVLYSLVCDQVMNLPAWTQAVMDID